MTEDGKFNTENSGFDHITQEINKRYPKTIVDEGDLIVEVRGTYIGKCALVPDSLAGANISPNTMRVVCDRDKILPEYLWHFTFTERWKAQIADRTNYWKGGFGTIKSTDLLTVKVPRFKLGRQKSILERLKKADLIYEQFSRDAVNCRKIYQAALAQVFGSVNA